MTRQTGGVKLLCEGYAFFITKTAVEESPVLLALGDSANEADGFIRVTDFDLDAVNCLVEFLKRSEYEANCVLIPGITVLGK